MSENSAGSTTGDKAKARVDVELIVGTILVGALCGTLLGILLGWRLGIYVGIGVVVVAVALHLMRDRFERSGRLYTESACPDLSPLSDGPRNYIICLDGTWNLPGVPTNVRKLYEWLDLDDDRQKQIARYYPGVGTRDLIGARTEFVKNWFAKTLVGGTIAYGPYGALSILKQAYFDFVKYYRPGDRIFIFGFSRGAATARALANYICKTHGLPGSVEIKYLKNRIQKDIVMDLTITDERKSGTPEVELLGLWDAVGSTGNPYNKRELFDLTIPSKVKKVYHLVAIHERRKTFDVKLIDQDDRVEEIWFPGWHSNGGGGLKDSTLSDIALCFMVSRAKELGVVFRKDSTEIRCDLQGDLSAALWKPGRIWLWKPIRQVRVQSGKPEAKPRIHKSVFRLKNADPKYDPKNIPNQNAYTPEERD